MGIAAHLHGARRLALVAEGVHVADNRVGQLLVRLDEHVERPDVDHLVDSRRERDGGPRHLGQLGTPHAAGDRDRAAFDASPVGHHSRDAGTVRARHSLDVEDFGVGKGLQMAGLGGPAAHLRARLQRIDRGDARCVEAAQDDVGVDEGHQFDDFVDREELSLDAPAFGRRHTATELLEALFAARHLDAAASILQAERLVLKLAVDGEIDDLLGVVDGEDEVRGVPGGSAWVRQRPFVEQDDVGPAEIAEMAHQAIAHDPSTDDDTTCPRRKVAHSSHPPPLPVNSMPQPCCFVLLLFCMMEQFRSAEQQLGEQ